MEYARVPAPDRESSCCPSEPSSPGRCYVGPRERGRIISESHSFTVDGYQVSVKRSARAWARAVQELTLARAPVPLQHQPAWTSSSKTGRHLYVTARLPGERCVCGFAVREYPSRTMPGHRLLFAARIGSAAVAPARAAAIKALASWASSKPRVLRVYADAFSLDPSVFDELAPAFVDAGYVPRPKRTDYRQTLVVDLRPREEEIFACFHGTARRHVRAPYKKGFEVRGVTDLRFAERLEELTRSAIVRTGGDYHRKDWRFLLEFAQRHGDLVKIVGTFDPSIEGPKSLIGFVLGEFHGDHATYSAAATARDGVAIPTTYAPTWVLMKWAKEQGAAFFDFGGIPGNPTTNDPLAGISSFKRYFSGRVIAVRQEWVFEPAPVRSSVARSISVGVASMRQLFRTATSR